MESVGDDTLLEDIDNCIEVWSSQSQLAIASGQVGTYDKLNSQISTLLDFRYKLSHSTDESTKELAKANAIKILQHRSEEIDEFIFPIDEVGDVLTEQMNASLCRIYEMHKKSLSSSCQNAYCIPGFDG